MEPVEINAGQYYLRTLRADAHLDDRPALVAAYADPATRPRFAAHRIDDEADAETYIHHRAEQWAQDTRYTWAIAEPTTGNLLGEVALDDLDPATGHARTTCWTRHNADADAAGTALDAITRFAREALGYPHVIP